MCVSYKEKNVLVTGGAGFIGSELVGQLSRAGANVTVFDNFSSGKKEYLKPFKKIKIIKGDIVNKQAIQKAVKDQEIIFNLAALPFIPDSFYYPEEFFQVNTIGTLNVLGAATKASNIESFVHISTSEVYGSAQFVPMDENHPTFPYSTYAVSKLAGDRATFTLHKENGIPSVIIRPFNSYGPRYTQPYIIPEIMIQLLKGSNKLVLGNLNSSRDLTYVEDTASAIMKSGISKKAIGEIINVGSGNEVRIEDLAKKIIKIYGKKIKIKTDESRLRPFDVNRLVCDNSKAKSILKWTPKVSLDKGLKRTFFWAKNHTVDFKAPFKRWYFK